MYESFLVDYMEKNQMLDSLEHYVAPYKGDRANIYGCPIEQQIKSVEVAWWGLTLAEMNVLFRTQMMLTASK